MTPTSISALGSVPGPAGPVAVVPAGTALGLGLDLVDVDRFRRVLSRRPSLKDRLFTADEAVYARRFADPVPSFAARFAAKEAVMKALGVGLGAFAFTDVEVRRLASGQPVLALSGEASTLAKQSGVRTWLLSLTHTDTTAGAVVLALA